MSNSARLERKTLAETAEQELRQAIALTLHIVQTDYSPSDESLVYSREHHLPDAFHFIVWRRGPTRLQSPLGEAGQ